MPTTIVFFAAILAMTELFLHLGLHKTGTTHLESVFHVNNEALRAAGVGFIRTGEHRKFALEKRLDSVGGTILNPAGSGQEAAKLAERLAMPKVLISDENIIGKCGAFSKEGLPYASLAKNLRLAIRNLGQKRRVHIWLSVRNYADWLESCYLQTFKHKTFGNFEDFLKKADVTRLSWPTLVRDLRRALPSASLLVWPYEVYRADPGPVMDAIEHEIGARLEARPNEDRNPSFSDLARLILETTKGQYRTPQDLDKMHRFLKKEFGSAKGYGRSPLLDAETRASLTRRYQQDWAEVAAMAGTGFRCIGTVDGSPGIPAASSTSDNPNGYDGLAKRVKGWRSSKEP